MQKYWGKQILTHGRFPEVGQKQKTERKEIKKKKKERVNDGNKNGQATHGARKHAWRTQAAWAKRKKKVGENNGQLRFVRHHVWRTQARLDQLLFYENLTFSFLSVFCF